MISSLMGKKLKLKRGDSALIVANSSYKITTESHVILYKATTPSNVN